MDVPLSPKKKISVIFGTRPEAIKLAPVILALKDDAHFECRVCVTAQHREMLDQVLEVFEIVPDHDLNLMLPGQDLAELTAKSIKAIDGYLREEKPDMVLVQGDTTTVFCAALSAFYNRIPIGHVEAGLRTHNLYSPWPEEGNRLLTSHLAALHFAPTEMSRQNLLKEGIPEYIIHVTGNTVIDALFLALQKIKTEDLDVEIIRDLVARCPGLKCIFNESALTQNSNFKTNNSNEPKLILVTGHRRESFGEGFERICQALNELSKREDVQIVYPVHLNPNVQEPVKRMLGRNPRIHLIEPLNYLPFVYLMNRSYLILTDSGGVQEEVPSLGKPVLVMRETTERPEAIDAGTVKLVGTDPALICSEAENLMGCIDTYEAMSRAHNPYGDGKAAQRIFRLFGPPPAVPGERETGKIRKTRQSAK